MARLKSFTGGTLPRDFWNYKLNPVSGFSTAEREDNTQDDSKKYYKRETSITFTKSDDNG